MIDRCPCCNQRINKRRVGDICMNIRRMLGLRHIWIVDGFRKKDYQEVEIAIIKLLKAAEKS